MLGLKHLEDYEIPDLCFGLGSHIDQNFSQIQTLGNIYSHNRQGAVEIYVGYYDTVLATTVWDDWQHQVQHYYDLFYFDLESPWPDHTHVYFDQPAQGDRKRRGLGARNEDQSDTTETRDT